MIRSFKALGLALIALAAMTALSASAAQAGTLTVEPGPTVTLTGEQTEKHKFELTDHLIEGKPAATECGKAHFKHVGAGVGNGAETVTVHPEYTECKAFGLNATVNTTGCDYLLHLGAVTGTGWHVTTDVVCAAGSLIKITTATCEVTVGAQTGLATSQVTNGTTVSPMDLILHTKITGIKYTVVKDGIGCPLSGTGSFSKGDYNGTTTIKCFNHVEVQVSCTVH
jgi:hypothetical protein